jgi:hypothetical protein
MNDLLSSAIPALAFFPAFFVIILMNRKIGMLPVASIFYLLLLGLFILYLPFCDVLLGINSFFGFQLPRNPELNQRIAGIYFLAISAFATGNLVFHYFNKKIRVPGFRGLDDFSGNNSLIINILYGFQLLIWLLYFANLYASGIGVTGIFNPTIRSDDAILFSATYRFPMLELLSVSVPVALFLQLRLGGNNSWKWWLFLSFWLMMSLLGGWRFRIILFALFWLLHISSSGINLKKAVLLFGVLPMFMAWLTLNRMAVAKRQFELITFDLRQFDLNLFNNEFSNSRTFRACMSQPGWDSFPGVSGWVPNPESDMPLILEFSKAWIPAGWPWNPNPALSQPEEFFLLFGYAGMALAMALSGIWAFFLDRLNPGWFSGSLRIVLTALLFQWISRGYFPFQLKITLICLLPFLVLMLLSPYLPKGKNANKA